MIFLGGFVPRFSAPTHTVTPMTTADWVGIMVTLLIFAAIVIVLIMLDKHSNRHLKPPKWWDKDWDAFEPLWPNRPRGDNPKQWVEVFRVGLTSAVATKIKEEK